MTIYTADPGEGINQPLSNVPSGLGESLQASFSEGLKEGPIMSALRFSRADALASDPDSPIVSKTVADSQLKELGIKSIHIPDAGVTQSFLDNVTATRKEALARQQIAASAPSGFLATPLNVVAGLAGSMADPGNLAIGLIPFAGEAKAATLLGRAGERFVQGAAMGGLQTAIALPFTAQAAAAEGEDFTMADAMQNVFYGAVGGGVLHAGGGIIADLVRGRRLSAIDAATAESTPGTVSNEPPLATEAVPGRMAAVERRPAGDDGTAPLFHESVAREAEGYAYSRAYDDVTPDYSAQLQAVLSARLDNVADLRAELAEKSHQAARLDTTLASRIKVYQQQRMKYREARQQALNDIAAEKQELLAANEQISQQLDGHAAAERAKGELAAISRGELPDNLKTAIDGRAGEILRGLQQTTLAGGVKSAAQQLADVHWTQRESAFRAGISHMLQGKTPDLEPFMVLNDPARRAAAIKRIQEGPLPENDPATVRASAEAESQFQRAARQDSELASALEDFESEIELARNIAEDLDPEMKAALDAIEKEAADDSLIKGLQAYASCMLRRI